MITVIIVAIAFYLASKGKKSLIMMWVYTMAMMFFYLIMMAGAVNNNNTNSLILLSVQFILNIFLCFFTISSTNKIAEKTVKMKILQPVVSNFKLQEERINNKLTPQQVAGIIGINKKIYEKYELGQEDIPVSTLIQLAQLYKVSTDHLLGMEVHEIQKTDQGSEQQS